MSFNDEDGPAKGLRDGIELYKAAEQLGYQSGWAYQRHFDHYLSSPLPFFAAAGQHTKSITLGSAVIPMRYQDPILLAEAAGTTDLLIGERLELAISTGRRQPLMPCLVLLIRMPGRRQSAARHVFLAAVSGEVLHTTGPNEGLAEGVPLRVTPHSPTLRSRIRQGSASIGSAVQAAELGLGLIAGTVQHDHEDGESFSAYQARIIETYRTQWRKLWHNEPPPVVVAASILVGTTPELREKYAAYDHERRTQGIAASRPKGAIPPAAPVNRPPGSQISPVFHGSPTRCSKLS